MATEGMQAASVSSAEAGCELARRLAQAEEAAYADLCGRFAAALHRYAASRLDGDRELAEDMVAETLGEAVRYIRRFDPRKASLRAWLFGIARRRVQAEWQRQRRKRSVPAEAEVPMEALVEVADGTALDLAVAQRVEAQRQVARLSVVLSQGEMELLLLSHVEGFTASEIGRVVGRSARAVETLLHRTRQKARACLGDDDG